MNENYFIAVDFHCKYQKVAWMDRATGETGEADLEHEVEFCLSGIGEGLGLFATILFRSIRRRRNSPGLSVRL